VLHLALAQLLSSKRRNRVLASSLSTSLSIVPTSRCGIVIRQRNPPASPPAARISLFTTHILLDGRRSPSFSSPVTRRERSL
jgi:hypothetical protein